MAAEATAEREASPKAKRGALRLTGIGLCVVGLAGAGFYGTYSGLIPWPLSGGHGEAAALPEIQFVPVDPVVVSLGRASDNRHLRFRAQLEVNQPYGPEVTLLLPRIQDVLNGYLRAVDATTLEDPGALVRIRAQLLRRIQMVTGEGRVRDLLVSEFVLN